MKITVEKEKIIEGALKAAAIIPQKAGAAYLRSMWLKAENGSLSIMATDANIEFTGVYAAKVEEPGLTGVQGRNFVDLLRQMPNGEIHFSLDADSNNLLVKQGKRSYKLPVSAPDWFQPPSAFPEDPSVPIAADLLQDLLEHIAFCIDDDDSRDALACLYFNPRPNDRIDVCGLNGHQFALKYFDNPDLSQRISEGGLLIQKKYLPDMRKWLGGDASETVELNFTQKRLYLRRQEGLEILSMPRAHQEYPDYNLFLSKLDGAGVSTLSLPRKEVMDAFGRILVFNTDSERCVFFDLSEKELELSGEGADGSGKENVDVEYAGDLRRIAFPTKNLMEIFGHFDSPMLEMIFTGQEGPCGIRGAQDPEYTVIIMPMKVAEKTYYTEEDL